VVRVGRVAPPLMPFHQQAQLGSGGHWHETVGKVEAVYACSTHKDANAEAWEATGTMCVGAVVGQSCVHLHQRHTISCACTSYRS
jgi:hypothetical protein